MRPPTNHSLEGGGRGVAASGRGSDWGEGGVVLDVHELCDVETHSNLQGRLR
jgi:hypothetical protein